jgi:replicative DNA helicase
MAKINKDNLGYLGLDFQYRVILQILTDSKFANSILDIVSPNYFEDSHLRIIVATIKDAFEKHETIPDLGSLKSRLLENVKDEIDLRSVLSQLRRIEESELNDTFYIQETAIKFCKTQELIKAIKQMDGIIKTGTIDDYDKLEEILKKALEKGDTNDGTIDVCDNIDSVLSDDYRNPIPTGIEGLDEEMDGGLAKSELGIILAAWGVGKTTMITKMANHAKRMGYNVMQIFFEDTPKIIQRKHISCWTKIPLNELQSRRIEAKVEFEKFDKTPGKLKLVKLKSDSTTIPKIKQLIRKNIAKGFKPDLILIDYIDCVLPSKNHSDVHEGQGAVMRELETMLSEFDIAGWTATQGNRCCSLDTIIDIQNKGKIEIKDVKVNDNILTHDGYKKVSHVFPIEKQAVYKIKTKSGKEIKVSARHEFPVVNGKLMSISSGLSVGDKLLLKSFD